MALTNSLVSIIIPVYNVSAYIERCIKSVMNQTYIDIECIIVDDGSKECAVNSLGALADQLIYIRQRNQGLSAARNTGLQLATGKYIQFIDGDDYLLQVPYEHCLDHIRYNDADMVLFDYDVNDCESANDLYEKVAPTSGTSYMRHNNIHGMACGYLFRKTTLSDLRFTNGIYHEDEEFTPQLLIRAEVLYPTKVKAYYYNSRKASITNTTDKPHVEKRLNDVLQVIKTLHYTADRLPNNDQLAMERRVAQLTMDHIYNTILLTRSEEKLKETLSELRKEGLFPLPNHPYSTKYTWFRRLSNNSIGRKILLTTLPLMKKER